MATREAKSCYIEGQNMAALNLTKDGEVGEDRVKEKFLSINQVIICTVLFSFCFWTAERGAEAA